MKDSTKKKAKKAKKKAAKTVAEVTPTVPTVKFQSISDYDKAQKLKDLAAFAYDLQGKLTAVEALHGKLVWGLGIINNVNSKFSQVKHIVSYSLDSMLTSVKFEPESETYTVTFESQELRRKKLTHTLEGLPAGFFSYNAPDVAQWQRKNVRQQQIANLKNTESDALTYKQLLVMEVAEAERRLAVMKERIARLDATDHKENVDKRVANRQAWLSAKENS